MNLKRQIINNFLKFLVFSAILSVSIASFTAAQETTNNKKEWKFYTSNFKNTGAMSSIDTKTLESSGRNLLQTSLLEAVEGSGIVLLFVLADEDIPVVLKLIARAQKIPSKFEEMPEDEMAKFRQAKYIILPKFFCLESGRFRMDVELFPVNEGAINLGDYVIFYMNELDSKIKMLASALAGNIFEKEGIKRSSTFKKPPRIGIRDFKNCTDDKECDNLRLLYPRMIRPIAAKKIDNFYTTLELTEKVVNLTDAQFAAESKLDILITGSFYKEKEHIWINYEIVSAFAKNLGGSDSPTIMESSNVDRSKLQELAGQIVKTIENIRLNFQR